MRLDLETLSLIEKGNGEYNITDSLKNTLKRKITSKRIEDVEPIDNSDTVTLYHGTTSAFLNDILENGILPRSETNHHNWEHVPSIPTVVYMTNKWQYFYAYRATNTYITEVLKEKEPWFKSYKSYPCYIECKIPKALLVPDEDFIHSKYIETKVKSALKKNKSEVEISWEECLANFATVGVIGGIKKEYIKSFSVLGEVKLMFDLFLDDKSNYMKDFTRWSKGKGKGNVKPMDLFNREPESTLNRTFTLKEVPKNHEIHQIGISPKNNHLSISFEKKVQLN